MKFNFSMFTKIVLIICRLFDASITSWIRSEKRNADVGGHSLSKHKSGLAVDIIPDDPAKKPEIVAHAQKLGLIAVDEGDHVHIQVPHDVA